MFYPIYGAETTAEMKRLSAGGTSISFLSNLPNSMTFPTEYASVITDDLFGMGRAMADLITEQSGDTIRLLYIYHDADYYVTNQRDRSFINVLNLVYPNVIVVDSIGITSPTDVTEQLATFLEQRADDIDVIYTPWATVAEEVLPLLKGGNHTIDLYTVDLSSPLFHEMMTGDIVKGFVSDHPQELGRSLLISTILHHANLATPPFSIVPVSTVIRENGIEQWTVIMGTTGKGGQHE